ncbi:hypothetical protein F52700_3562 [Fusarium sp. NRRL 52700]|nr:hypothetical protein F52700_3562 [Fusarium sp. NRRL 52700]
MVSTAVTTQEELNKILSAGSQSVMDIYQRFRKQFPGQRMKEVGLTDVFMMVAQENSPTGVKFELRYDENQTGCDFQVTFNGDCQVFFQAKVAKKQGNNTYANFLYESKRDDLPDYQNVLLAEYAKKNKTAAYYIIYDEKEVSWVNAIVLQNWILKTGNLPREETQVCIAAFKALARTSYIDALNDLGLAKF